MNRNVFRIVDGYFNGVFLFFDYGGSFFGGFSNHKNACNVIDCVWWSILQSSIYLLLPLYYVFDGRCFEVVFIFSK